MKYESSDVPSARKVRRLTRRKSHLQYEGLRRRKREVVKDRRRWKDGEMIEVLSLGEARIERGRPWIMSGHVNKAPTGHLLRIDQ